jgi:hypothetical protein
LSSKRTSHSIVSYEMSIDCTVRLRLSFCSAPRMFCRTAESSASACARGCSWMSARSRPLQSSRPSVSLLTLA